MISWGAPGRWKRPAEIKTNMATAPTTIQITNGRNQGICRVRWCSSNSSTTLEARICRVIGSFAVLAALSSPCKAGSWRVARGGMIVVVGSGATDFLA